MEYDWYKKIARDKVKGLKGNTPEILLARNTVSDLLNPEKNCIKYLPKTYTDLEYMLLDIKKIRFAFQTFKDFNSIHSEDIVYNTSITRMEFSNEELVELMHDFYKNGTDKETYENFLKLYNPNHLKIMRDSNTDFYANSFYLPYYKELYVQEKPLGEFTDLSTLCHEYGHGIQNINNFDYLVLYRNKLFIEIVSTFFENLCTDYYTVRGNHQEAAANTQADRLSFMKMLNDDTCELIYLYETLEVDKIDKNELRKRIKELMSISEDKENAIDLYRAQAHINPMYVFGYLVSNELYMIYLKDKEKAFYLLSKIMKLDLSLSSEEYFNSILELGIVPNENGLEYDEQLKLKLMN